MIPSCIIPDALAAYLEAGVHLTRLTLTMRETRVTPRASPIELMHDEHFVILER